MRNLFISAALLLAACGPSEESFTEDFFAAACDAGCDDSEFYCAVGDATGETETDGESSCEFDKKAAKECLDGAFACEDNGAGGTFTSVPEVCGTVCG